MVREDPLPTRTEATRKVAETAIGHLTTHPHKANSNMKSTKKVNIFFFLSEI